MQSWQTQVDDLSEILINSIDSLSSGGSDSRPEAIDDFIYLEASIFSVVGSFEKLFYFFHHFVAACCETRHLG